MRRGRSAAANRTAVVAGASGLVGRDLLVRLLRRTDYGEVIALTRRPLPPAARMREVPAQFDRLESALDGVVGTTSTIHAYCCLGTTIRNAGSEAAFRRVDYDHVLSFARWAVDHAAARRVVITALGADARSRVFYNRVKGEVESSLRSLAGDALVIVRPSLLDGRREETRFGEKLGLSIARPFARWLPAAIRPVAAADVAQSMIDAALAIRPAAVIESAAMHGAARRADGRVR